MTEPVFLTRPRGVWQEQESSASGQDTAGQNTAGQDASGEAASEDAYADYCVNCHVRLTRDDIGLHRKLINRNATAYLCKKCLGEKFSMTMEECDTLIAYFRADGCHMFN